MEKGVTDSKKLIKKMSFFAFVSLVSILVIFFYVSHVNTVRESSPACTIKTLRISSDQPLYIPLEEIEEAIFSTGEYNLFQIDLEKSQKTLESLPGICAASFKKEPPNQLLCLLTLRTPIARSGSLERTFIDQYGVFFTDYPTRAEEELPYLILPKNTQELWPIIYKDFLAYHQLFGKHLASIDFSRRFSLKKIEQEIILTLRFDQKTILVRFLSDTSKKNIENLYDWVKEAVNVREISWIDGRFNGFVHIH